MVSMTLKSLNFASVLKNESKNVERSLRKTSFSKKEKNRNNPRKMRRPIGNV